MPVLAGIMAQHPFIGYKYRDQLKTGRFYDEKKPESLKKAEETVEKKAKGIIKRRENKFERKRLEKFVKGDGSFNPESMIEPSISAVATVEEKLAEPVNVVELSPIEPSPVEQPANALLEEKGGNYFKRLKVLRETNPEEYARIKAENQAKARATREKKTQKRMKVMKVKKIKPLPPTPERKKAKPLPAIPKGAENRKKLLNELKGHLDEMKSIKKMEKKAKNKDVEKLLKELEDKIIENELDLAELEKEETDNKIRKLLPSKKPSPPPNKPKKLPKKETEEYDEILKDVESNIALLDELKQKRKKLKKKPPKK